MIKCFYHFHPFLPIYLFWNTARRGVNRLIQGRTIIKVKVYAPAFINHEPISPDGTVTLEDCATLYDLYSRLKIPITLRLVCFCSVNYEAAKWNTKLKDGDTVTFLFPISGG